MVRVPAARILEAWSRCAPELLGRPEQLTELDTTLRELAACGELELPGSRSWDRSTTPPVPHFVVIPAARPLPREPHWRTHPWCSELGWAASARTMTDAQYAALVAIHDWLVAGGAAQPIVPARLRSAEILGDEKALERLATTSLFARGRLTYELLRARRLPPPLHIVETGAGPDLLVVENSDPFWVCCDVAARSPRVGRVAFGAGQAFLASSAAIALEEQLPERVFYWGDLDPKGVAIPTEAARTLTSLGIELAPAVPLWYAMILKPQHATGSIEWRDDAGGWLGGELWTASQSVRKAKARVAQEMLTVDDIDEAIAELGR
jgi:hypothetical protein